MSAEGGAVRVETGAFRGSTGEELCSRTYLMYLRMYIAAYQLLSSRERSALHMVEVEGKPYKAAAAALEIRLENLKMVIFRARKKILRTLDRVLTTAAAWQPEMVGGSRDRGLRSARTDARPAVRRRAPARTEVRALEQEGAS